MDVKAEDSLMLIKQELDVQLRRIELIELHAKYTFALTFMNFIKLVNGEQGESHKTPPVVESKSDHIAKSVLQWWPELRLSATDGGLCSVE